jgi:hypothetical protein
VNSLKKFKKISVKLRVRVMSADEEGKEIWWQMLIFLYDMEYSLKLLWKKGCEELFSIKNSPAF